MLEEAEIHRAQARDTLLFHIYTINDIHSSHGGFVVRHAHTLGLFGEFLHDPVEFLNVGIVQWRIHFIKHAERCRLEQIQGEEQSCCRQKSIRRLRLQDLSR